MYYLLILYLLSSDVKLLRGRLHVDTIERQFFLGASLTEYSTRPLLGGKWGLVLRKPATNYGLGKPSKRVVFQVDTNL